MVTSVYCGKTADSIDIAFGMMSLVDLRNHALDHGVQIPPRVSDNLFGGGCGVAV